MSSFNSIRKFWNELNVQFQFSHLIGKHCDTVLVIRAHNIALQNLCSFQGKG